MVRVSLVGLRELAKAGRTLAKWARGNVGEQESLRFVTPRSDNLSRRTDEPTTFKLFEHFKSLRLE